jgi:uncharacterized membrane protein YgcG
VWDGARTCCSSALSWQNLGAKPRPATMNHCAMMMTVMMMMTPPLCPREMMLQDLLKARWSAAAVPLLITTCHHPTCRSTVTRHTPPHTKRQQPQIPLKRRAALTRRTGRPCWTRTRTAACGAGRVGRGRGGAAGGRGGGGGGRGAGAGGGRPPPPPRAGGGRRIAAVAPGCYLEVR